MSSTYVLADVEDVLKIAAKFPVFPCGIDKKPLTKNGFYDATQDESQIRAWWKAKPEALVGVPCGQKTGLVVIDLDPGKAQHATNAWVQSYSAALMATRTHSTRRAGRHWLFRSTEQYASGADIWLDGEKRVGLDVRGEGGYIIWWPVHGATAVGEIQDLPPALLADRRRAAPSIAAPQKSHALLISDSNWAASRDRVMQALAYLNPEERDLWVKVGQAIHIASGASDDGFHVWHHWSAGGFQGVAPANYVNERDCRYAWSSFNQRIDGKQLVTLGSVFAAAYANGMPRADKVPELPQDDRFAPFDPGAYEDLPPDLDGEEWSEPVVEPKQSLELRKPIQWSKLEGREPPHREWAVEGWIGRGHVTLLSGPPGSGKTAICQTIGAAVSLGIPCIDNVPRAMNTLGWFGEDDEFELWRRQIAIAAALKQPLSAFDNKLVMQPYPSTDITLCTASHGVLEQTSMLKELREQIGDYRAELVFLDSVSRVFGGNENDRHHVTQFIAWLTWALEPTNAALVLLGHPAKGQGSEFSGSTAWEASVRARLFFGYNLPDQDNKGDDAVEDPEARILAKRKTNYSQKDIRQIRWMDGCMQPVAGDINQRRNKSPEFLADEAVRVFRRLKGMGLNPGAQPSMNYLPKLAVKNRILDGDTTEKEIRIGLAEALKSGRLHVGTIGYYANRAPRTGLMEG